MLVNQKTLVARTRDEPLPLSTPESIVVKYFWIARRHFWIILICLLSAGSIGAFYLLSARPIYTASATMVIDSRKGGVQQKSVLGDEPTDGAGIDSQIGVLVLQRDKIGLAVTEKLPPADYNAIVEPDNDDVAVPSIFKLFFGRNDNRTAARKSESELKQQAASAIANGLDVKRVGLTYLITIYFSGRSPDQVVKITNTAADAYVVAEMEAKYKAIRQASDWLQERYQTLHDQASAADRAAIEFKEKNNIVTSGGKLIGDQQIGEVNSRLSAARARTAESQSKLNQIQDVLKSQEGGGMVDATVSDTLANPIITKLRMQYLDVVNREADWSARFGPNHLAVVNLRNQERDIQKSIHEELKRIGETYKSDLEIAKKDQAELEKQLAEAVAKVPNDAQVTLRGLETTAQSYRTFYDNFFLNYTEAVQQQSSPIPDTQIVSYASGAYKSYPSPSRIISMSLLGGLGLGIGLAMFRERGDRTCRTGAQIEAALEIRCLALIPLMKHHRQETAQAKQLTNGTDSQRIFCAGLGALHYLTEDPFSRFMEGIRAIKLAADLHCGGSHSAAVIGITSTLPREGKTTISTVLAGLMGEVGKRVILVDCDLRNPSLSRMLTPNADAGILEVISGVRLLNESIWTDQLSGIAFLPAVKTSRIPNTGEILAGDAMKRLFDLLRMSYDYIIVDLPPLAPVVDVRATTQLIDSYILIVEWGQTKIDVVQHAVREAQVVYESVLGIVLNKVDLNVINQYDGYPTEYYHNKHFAQYGYTD